MTGYKGRSGLYELLTVDDALREFVDQAPDVKRIRKHAIGHGMKPLRLSGAQKIAAGLTTFDEVIKAAPPIDQ